MNVMRGPARSGAAITKAIAGPSKGSGGDATETGVAPASKATATPAGPHFTNQEKAQISTSLLSWYDRVHRVLPWRRTPHSTKSQRAPAAAATGAAGAAGTTATGAAAAGAAGASAPAAKASKSGAAKAAKAAAAEAAVAAATAAPDSLDPQQFAYYVWVSEVMLQQTQVATVIPFFNKWVARWPTVAELAAAEVEEVNAMWAGLGYYRRARYLLDGSKYVMEKLHGSFPTTAKELLQVPGVGPYTAAAVASIAFNDPSAAVDGNVIRVVSRLRALAGDPTKLAQWHAAMAQDMLDTSRPGCFNQAVMELGATVCRPLNPDCAACPVRPSCRAHAEWQAYLEGGGQPDMEDAPCVTRYPGKKQVKDKREESVAVCVLELVVMADGKKNEASGDAAGGKSGEGKDKGKGKGAKGKDGKDDKDGKEQQPAAKRQRTMFEFARDEAAGTRSSAVTEALAKGERWVLLVQRPDQGLLAGLWEFPGMAFEGDLPRSERQALTSGLLSRLLGLPFPAPDPATSKKQQQRAMGGGQKDGGAATDSDAAGPSAAGGGGEGATATGLQVVSRHDMGSFVHVFSHIRQTNHVEKIVAVVNSLEEVQAAAAAAAAAAAGAEGGGATAASAGTTAATGSSKGGKAVGRKGRGKAAETEEKEEEEDGEEEEEEGDGSEEDEGKSKRRKKSQGGAPGKKGKAASKGKRAASSKGSAKGEREETAAWPQLRWIRPADVSGAGLPTLTKKVFKQASGEAQATK